MPNEPEAHGLLALMLHCEARRAARYAREGEFVPLDQQDTALWSRPTIDEAESHLCVASAFKRLGRYQLEAAIQSITIARGRFAARSGFRVLIPNCFEQVKFSEIASKD